MTDWSIFQVVLSETLDKSSGKQSANVNSAYNIYRIDSKSRQNTVLKVQVIITCIYFVGLPLKIWATFLNFISWLFTNNFTASN